MKLLKLTGYHDQKKPVILPVERFLMAIADECSEGTRVYIDSSNATTIFVRVTEEPEAVYNLLDEM